ncbi:MAG TPA: hypothetical protein VIV11_20275 [Kofleriaceae bacterium]
MRSVVAIILLAACAEPVVEMQLVLPQNADNFDTTCITAVEVRVTGGNFLQDSKDYRRSCVEITGVAGYAAIRDAIKGRFDVAIPDTGISGIEIYGWSGPTACENAGKDDPFVTPNLLFMGRGDYIGQDRVDIPVVPNLSCTRTPVNVRMFDMFALVGGKTCAEAGDTALIGLAGVGVGTMVPRMMGKGARFYGNIDGGDTVGNLASFQGPTQIGPKACLGIDAGDFETAGTVGCAIGGSTVCAGAGEIETAAMPFAISTMPENYDTALLTKFPGQIFGTVWSSATPRTTLAGATVTVDPAHGQVVYLDPPNAAGAMAKRADQTMTGPSGLFALYTDTLISAKIQAGASSRTVTLGSPNEAPAGAMIVMEP